MPFPLRYDCIFFDFDGVIVDSVEAKIAAFGALYEPFGADVRAAVEAYQRAVPGETRYEKIPRFHRELLGIELSPAEVEQWCARLSTLVLDEVVASPLLPDVTAVLATLRRHGVATHIVSGTPHDELQVIVDRKDLRPWFTSVQGAPRRKAPIVRGLMTSGGLASHRCLFVGDAMTDYDCAQQCRIDFVGRIEGGKDPFPPGTHVVERLGDALPTSARGDAGLRLAA
jgi:phosphoglycolate phosphatase-like HAD superfamily hydrolase